MEGLRRVFSDKEDIRRVGAVEFSRWYDAGSDDEIPMLQYAGCNGLIEFK